MNHQFCSLPISNNLVQSLQCTAIFKVWLDINDLQYTVCNQTSLASRANRADGRSFKKETCKVLLYS